MEHERGQNGKRVALAVWIAAFLLVVVVAARLQSGAVRHVRRESDRIVEGLRRQLQEARQAQAQLTEEMSKANQRVALLSSQVQQSQEQLTRELAESKERLNQAVSNSPGSKQTRQELEMLRRQLDQERKQGAQTRTEKERTQQRTGDLEKRLSDREAEAKALEQQLDTARASLREMENQLRQARSEQQREIDRLRRDLQTAQSARDKLAREVEAGRADREAVKRAREELGRANDRIADLIVALDAQEQLSMQQGRRGN